MVTQSLSCSGVRYTPMKAARHENSMRTNFIERSRIGYRPRAFYSEINLFRKPRFGDSGRPKACQFAQARVHGLSTDFGWNTRAQARAALWWRHIVDAPESQLLAVRRLTSDGSKRQLNGASPMVKQHGPLWHDDRVEPWHAGGRGRPIRDVCSSDLVAPKRSVGSGPMPLWSLQRRARTW